MKNLKMASQYIENAKLTNPELRFRLETNTKSPAVRVYEILNNKIVRTNTFLHGKHSQKLQKKVEL